MEIVRLLHRHRTWLEVVDYKIVRKHTVVRSGKMTEILCRVLVVKSIYPRPMYKKGTIWQIAEYDLDKAVKQLRTEKGFQQRAGGGKLTLKDVEQIIKIAPLMASSYLNLASYPFLQVIQTMISKILYFVLLSALFLVPCVLYMSRRKFMTRFYLGMTALVSARKLYRMMLLIVLLVFHYLHFSVFVYEVGMIFSTIAFTTFFMFMNVDKWLQRLHEERAYNRVAFVSILVFAFTPHLLTMAVTLSFLLLAAQFYPSRYIVSFW